MNGTHLAGYGNYRPARHDASGTAGVVEMSALSWCKSATLGVVLET